MAPELRRSTTKKREEKVNKTRSPVKKRPRGKNILQDICESSASATKQVPEIINIDDSSSVFVNATEKEEDNADQEAASAAVGTVRIRSDLYDKNVCAPSTSNRGAGLSALKVDMKSLKDIVRNPNVGKGRLLMEHFLKKGKELNFKKLMEERHKIPVPTSELPPILPNSDADTSTDSHVIKQLYKILNEGVDFEILDQFDVKSELLSSSKSPRRHRTVSYPPVDDDIAINAGPSSTPKITLVNLGTYENSNTGLRNALKNAQSSNVCIQQMMGNNLAKLVNGSKGSKKESGVATTANSPLVLMSTNTETRARENIVSSSFVIKKQGRDDDDIQILNRSENDSIDAVGRVQRKASKAMRKRTSSPNNSSPSKKIIKPQLLLDSQCTAVAQPTVSVQEPWSHQSPVHRAQANSYSGTDEGPKFEPADTHSPFCDPVSKVQANSSACTNEPSNCEATNAPSPFCASGIENPKEVQSSHSPFQCQTEKQNDSLTSVPAPPEPTRQIAPQPISNIQQKLLSLSGTLEKDTSTNSNISSDTSHPSERVKSFSRVDTIGHDVCTDFEVPVPYTLSSENVANETLSSYSGSSANFPSLYSRSPSFSNSRREENQSDFVLQIPVREKSQEREGFVVNASRKGHEAYPRRMPRGRGRGSAGGSTIPFWMLKRCKQLFGPRRSHHGNPRYDFEELLNRYEVEDDDEFDKSDIYKEIVKLTLHENTIYKEMESIDRDIQELVKEKARMSEEVGRLRHMKMRKMRSLAIRQEVDPYSDSCDINDTVFELLERSRLGRHRHAEVQTCTEATLEALSSPVTSTTDECTRLMGEISEVPHAEDASVMFYGTPNPKEQRDENYSQYVEVSDGRVEIPTDSGVQWTGSGKRLRDTVDEIGVTKKRKTGPNRAPDFDDIPSRQIQEREIIVGPSENNVRVTANFEPDRIQSVQDANPGVENVSDNDGPTDHDHSISPTQDQQVLFPAPDGIVNSEQRKVNCASEFSEPNRNQSVEEDMTFASEDVNPRLEAPTDNDEWYAGRRTNHENPTVDVQDEEILSPLQGEMIKSEQREVNCASELGESRRTQSVEESMATISDDANQRLEMPTDNNKYNFERRTDQENSLALTSDDEVVTSVQEESIKSERGEVDCALENSEPNRIQRFDKDTISETTDSRLQIPTDNDQYCFEKLTHQEKSVALTHEEEVLTPVQEDNIKSEQRDELGEEVNQRLEISTYNDGCNFGKLTDQEDSVALTQEEEDSSLVQNESMKEFEQREGECAPESIENSTHLTAAHFDGTCHELVIPERDVTINSTVDSGASGGGSILSTNCSKPECDDSEKSPGMNDSLIKECDNYEFPPANGNSSVTIATSYILPSGKKALPSEDLFPRTSNRYDTRKIDSCQRKDSGDTASRHPKGDTRASILKQCPFLSDFRKEHLHSNAILDVKVWKRILITCSLDGTIQGRCILGHQPRSTVKNLNAKLTCLTIANEMLVVGTKENKLFVGPLMEFVPMDCVRYHRSSHRLMPLQSKFGKSSCVLLKSDVTALHYSWGFVFVGSTEGLCSRVHVPSRTFINSFVCGQRWPILDIQSYKEGSRKLIVIASKHSVTIRDSETGLLLRSVAPDIVTSPTCIAICANKLYCATTEHMLIGFVITSGEEISRAKYRAETGVTLRALVTKPNLLISACYDGKIRIFKQEKGVLLYTLETGSKDMLYGVSLCQDKIFAGTSKGDLLTWTIPSFHKTAGY